MWISTKRGHINSRFVRSVHDRQVPGADGKKRWTKIIVTDDGNEIEVIGGIDLEDEVARIIPAAQPMLLIILWFDPETGEFHQDRCPIIGWRVSEGGWPTALAIGAVDPSLPLYNGMQIIALPEGGYLENTYEGERFGTFEDCQKWLRDRVEKRVVA